MSKKDPAFLFYSKDFYEGTRLMLPEERACLVDLMIYQHQNGGIPNDIKRLSLYCSGISQNIIKSTLELKFKLTNNEWYSDKMTEVTTERYNKGVKNKLIGTFAHVIKKLELSKKDSELLKKRFNVDELLKISSEWDTERLTEWCKNAIPLIEDEDANENILSNDYIEEIYNTYPSKCIIKNSSTGKTSKNKDKIKSLLKEHTKDHLIKVINWYISECKKSNTYMKNFGTFLNNLPDIPFDEKPKTEQYTDGIQRYRVKFKADVRSFVYTEEEIKAHEQKWQTWVTQKTPTNLMK